MLLVVQYINLSNAQEVRICAIHGKAWIGVGLMIRCHFQVHCGSGNYGSKSWPELCWDYGTWMRTQLHALQGQHLFCIPRTHGCRQPLILIQRLSPCLPLNGGACLEMVRGEPTQGVPPMSPPRVPPSRLPASFLSAKLRRGQTRDTRTSQSGCT